VTHSLVARHEPERLDGLRVLGRTVRAPGLPYVTRATADEDLVRRLRAGIASAASDPALAEARQVLMITGVTEVDGVDYARIDAIESEAAEAGYPILA
jgi:ABC-type phosphate/phosphonate transport system substrate-binding protein